MMANPKEKRAYKSPLNDLPLRTPGQSIRDMRVNLVFDRLMPAFLMMFTCFAIAVVSWFQYWFPSSPKAPWLVTGLTLIAVVYLVWVFTKYWPELNRLVQAEQGEKAVGQFLEGLREKGYHVFHDVLGKDFNLDHVAIGPGGMFTLETKTWSKPIKGKPEIIFDGEMLSPLGKPKTQEPIIQAKAQANWLKNLVCESTGKTFPVRPVVLFPGWFVTATKEKRSEVWVLEPKALPAFLERAASAMSADDIKLAAYHLSRYIREEERMRAEAYS